MTDRGRTPSELIQGCVVLAVMASGLWWLVDAAWRSGNAWFKAGVALLIVPLLLGVAFIGWLVTCQWRRRWV